MDVKTLIKRYSDYYADRTAIIYNDKRLTFREVNDRSTRLANGLLALGVKKDDRIATLLGNCPEYIETMFAKHKIAAVDVILSPRVSQTDLEYQITDAGVSTIITDKEYVSRLPERSKLPNVRNWIVTNGPVTGWVDYESIVAQGTDKRAKHRN